MVHLRKVMVIGFFVLYAASGLAHADPITNSTQDIDMEDIERALERDMEASSPRGGTADPMQAPVSPRSFASGPTAGNIFNPDISLITDFALAAFTTDEPLQTGAHDPARNGFTLQGVELALQGVVDPYFRFDTFLNFSEFGVELEEAFATTLALPYNLQMRVGQFLTRFGRFNPTHPHDWSFVDQMLVIGKFFGAEANRGLGVEGSVLLPLPWYVELLASATHAHGAATARSFFGGNDLGVNSPADLQYTLAAKQFFPLSDHWSLLWGMSAALGPNATGRDNRTDIYGTDVYLKWRPVTSGPDGRYVALQAEYLHRARQVPEELLRDDGLYAYLIWQFAQRWQTGLRQEWVSGLENDPLDPEWTEQRTRTSGQLTFHPTEFSRLRAQVSYDQPGWRDPYWGAFLATEFLIGAHGAHKF